MAARSTDTGWLEKQFESALPVEQLEHLGEALLEFTAAAELDAWLAAHPLPSKAGHD